MNLENFQYNGIQTTLNSNVQCINNNHNNHNKHNINHKKNSTNHDISGSNNASNNASNRNRNSNSNINTALSNLNSTFNLSNFNGFSILSASTNKPKDQCVLCDRPRTRRDLCNRCRQKIEARARKLNEEKIIGDFLIFQHVIQFINKHITDQIFDKMTKDMYNQLLTDIFPYLVCAQYIY